MKDKSKFSLIILIILLLCPYIVKADVGPKPSITIYVENAPEELYYLDLVIEDIEEQDYYENIEQDKYSETMISQMKKETPSGTKLALIDGTEVPLFGELIGKPKGHGTWAHEFSYVGTPDRYRILIGLKDGQCILSNWHKREVFAETIYYDLETGTLETPSTIPTYLKQFALTFIWTLVIEGLILLFMGYSLKENLRYFLTINIITQLILTMITAYILIHNGSLTFFIAYLILEIFIAFGEAFYYKTRLIGKTEKRNIIYGLLANAVSFVLGFFIVHQFI